MADFKNWLRIKLRSWLEIDNIVYNIKTLNELYSDLVSIGVDVHFKSPHMILIYSQLNGGQLRYIEVNFNDLKELLQLVKELKKRYQTDKIWWDCPPFLQQLRNDRKI